MGRQSPARQHGPGKAWLLSRRNIIKHAAGLAVAGAAGTAVLRRVAGGPARIAGAPLLSAYATSLATTVEPGAVAPTVVSLTNGATIAVNASLGNDFRVTITGSPAMGNPTSPTDGQQIIFQVTQGSGGSAAITWGSSYEFSAGLPQPALSTAAGQTDLLGFIYNAAKGSWLLAAYVNGFS